MKVTYIEHSCFSVELQKVILLFDYFKGELPEFDENKTIYVFSSHNHHDHFDISIFQLLKRYQNVKYIFSKDIKRKFGRKFFNTNGVEDEVYENIEFININQTLQISDLTIETLRSTDEGVAFIITAEDKTIYHAGDLNLWWWNGRDKSDNERARENYEKEINKIKKRHFDIAFVVLDPRQGEEFYLGFDYFMKNTDTDKVYPIHCWNDISVSERLKGMDCSEKYRDKICSYQFN
ncbi:MBL fold metallo-hydrolase [Clostridium sp. C2-6-12]|uniref:MBL fold metallo-hydrolase n=1 Tax=Clostridium sp. C2-6-12 TaxID=2698832 RepID=UPI001371F596|nr:MBL fold metallo-hydrolase [Clostridium sp. C2-6-12]